jgi:hypothetical protein
MRLGASMLPGAFFAGRAQEGEVGLANPAPWEDTVISFQLSDVEDGTLQDARPAGTDAG